jgi:hypothetical protein
LRSPSWPAYRSGAARLAHDWFTERHDPITNYGCCGGSDCKELTPAFVKATIAQAGDGYWVTLTPEQIKVIAPGDGLPTTLHQFIPRERIQASESGGFAMCVVWDSVRCFFEPPGA